MPKLSELKWALVTGASSGIGREFALELARRNLNVVLVGRDIFALSKLAEEIHGLSSSKVIFIQADLVKDISYVLENTSSLRIDLLINNAGLGLYGEFLSHQWDEYANIIDLNVRVLTQLTHHYLKEMLHRGRGGIINVASVAGFFPIPKFAVYASTKAYVYNFSLALWAELRDKNIHVLCVAPGKTRTKFFERAKMRTDYKMMEPRDVVIGALKTFEAGKPLYIPGAGNKLTYVVIRRIFRDDTIAKVLKKFF